MPIIVWILFLLLELNFQCICAYQSHNKVITINNDGNNASKCCVDGHCPCSSLGFALQNVTSNNTLINITLSRTVLFVQTNINNVSMVTITGNNGTIIDCNNTGGISFSNCQGIDISGITWYQCGSKELHGAISLDHSRNVSIVDCKFQSSIAYGITVESLPGQIVIKETEFSYNNRSSSNNSGGLFIQQTQETSPPMNLELLIIQSMFKHNGAWSDYSGGINIWMHDSSTLLNISIEDSVFMNNFGSQSGGMYIFAHVNNLDLNVAVQLKNVTYVNNSALPITGHYNGDAVYCYTSGNNISFTMTNSSIYNSIVIFSASLHTSVVMDNSLLGNSIEGSYSLTIESYANLYVSFYNMTLMRTQVMISVVVKQNCVLKFDKSTSIYDSILKIDGHKSNGCQCSITHCQFSGNHVNNPIIDIQNIKRYSLYSQPFIQISNTTISDNANRDSIVRLAYQLGEGTPSGDVQLSSVAFTGNSAAESTLYVSNCKVRISNTMNFSNNAGTRGASMYFTNYSYAILDDNAEIEFINNVVALGGGAIYADHPPSGASQPWNLFHKTGKSVVFNNNIATEAGNSIYFNIPKDVVINRNSTSPSSIMYIPSQFNYSGKSYHNEISTSPYNLILRSPAVCINTQCDNSSNYKVEGIMLGEELAFIAKIVDYFNNSAEASIFLVEIANNDNEEYSLTGFSKYKNVLIQENPLHNITIVGNEVTSYNTTVSLHLSQVIGTVTSHIRNIEVSILIVLHPCKTGFKYDDHKKLCACNRIPDFVQCMLNDAKIKKGYWYGKLNGKIVVGVCPNNYCNYPSCDISENYCGLSSIENHQCHSHRIGIACGDCESNYTLAFDLKNCIPTSDCHIWLTVIIIICVIIFWFAALLVILCITRFVDIPEITGYAYGIIYFYSILDLFVGNNLVSDTMTKIIMIISGIANLTPRFLGMLCLFKGLSGIDQQFIHYIHPLAISLLLFLISRVAKHSGRVTTTLGRAGIIRATCLFILLSYTSIASTSLQLLRPLIFRSDGVHSSVHIHTYQSPDIQYFTGRHIAYAIVAIVLTIVIALGLPVFLLLQPCLTRCINFVKLVPLLDQFQQCFKAEYHSVAAFYLICRLLIFVVLDLVMISYSIRFLILQLLCFIFAMIHAWLQPYKEKKLNSLDQTILLIALIIVSLNVGISFTSLNASEKMNDSIVAILALFPLVVFTGILLSSTALGRFLWQKLTCSNKVNHRRRGSTVRLLENAADDDYGE